MPSPRDPKRPHLTSEQTLAAIAAQASRLREKALADLASLDAAQSIPDVNLAEGRERHSKLIDAVDQILQHVQQLPHDGVGETSTPVADTIQADFASSLTRRLEEES